MTGAERLRRWQEKHRQKKPDAAAERQRPHHMSAQKEIQMSEGAIQLRVAQQLPQTRDDLLAQYKLKRKKNINDLVEAIVVKLWDVDEQFMKYVAAIYDSEAVEGSMVEDDIMAAQLIREMAKKENNHEVARHNLHTIKLAMRVALRRFGVDRPTRFENAEIPPAPKQLNAPSVLLAGE